MSVENRKLDENRPAPRSIVSSKPLLPRIGALLR